MIKKDTIVTIRYSMFNSRGHLLEKSHATYVHGSAGISPILQSQLEGLHPGETRIVRLKKGEEGADDDYTFDVFIDDVRENQAIPLGIHLLSGFLGSGKTTAITQACRLLQRKNIRPAVITNDQGVRLVDGQLFDHLDIPTRQVTNGCFCCNYNDLDVCIDSLSRHNRPAVLFAESVGSCTDLVATVLKPLLRQHSDWRVTISVFADAQLLPSMLGDNSPFDPSVRYIYLKQLEEAHVIVVTKTDLLDDQGGLHRLMHDRYPQKTILFQNSFNDDHISRWLEILDETSPAGTATLPSLDIDYDLYGEGEASLAWLDQRLVIKSPSGNAQMAAGQLIRKLYESISEKGYPIGHLKFLLDDSTKISFTATGSADRPRRTRQSNTSSLLVNARIQTDPTILSALMAAAIRATENSHSCTIRILCESAFQPGYPRPTHRIHNPPAAT